MRTSVRRKIILVVLVAITVALIISDVYASVYFFGLQKENAVEGERYKLTQAAKQLDNFQEKVIAIGKQIVVNDELQRLLHQEDEDDVMQQLLVEDTVKKLFRTFINEQPYIYGVTIITEGGNSYSSNLTEEMFVPEEEPWYLEFKDSGKSQGFSSAHTYIMEQGARKIQVVSYVMSFRDLMKGNNILGDIILHVGIDEIEKYLVLPGELLSGSACYDSWGNSLTTTGAVNVSYEEVSAMTEPEQVLESRNILLKNDNLKDGWVIVGEVSNRGLLAQLRFIPMFFILIFLAVASVLFLVLHIFISTITRPIETLHQAALKVGGGDLDVEVVIKTGDELEVLGDAFNRMVEDIRRRMEESIAYEKTTKEMEINRLMLQINPHFIYNTLNSIVYMARLEGNKDIVTFANSFIALLQNTLKVSTDGIFISMEQELQNIHNYLVLQSYRYPELFEVKYDIEDCVRRCRVPNVLIQPMVENAIFHGLVAKGGRGTLYIAMKREDSAVIITVADDGLGMEEETVKRLLCDDTAIQGHMHTIGVSNVKKRIEHIYGEEYGLEIASRPGEGTRVTLRIPYEEYNGKDEIQEENNE